MAKTITISEDDLNAKIAEAVAVAMANLKITQEPVIPAPVEHQRFTSESDPFVIVSGGTDNRPLISDHDPETGRPVGEGIKRQRNAFMASDLSVTDRLTEELSIRLNHFQD